VKTLLLLLPVRYWLFLVGAKLGSANPMRVIGRNRGHEGKAWRIWIDLEAPRDGARGRMTVTDYGLLPLPLTQVRLTDQQLFWKRVDRSGDS